MKVLLAALTLLSFCLTSLAQSVTSPILGYVTLNLEQGSNFVGFALQPVLELQAVVSIDGTQRQRVFLTSPATVTNGQYGSGAAASHVLEFIDAGAGEGFYSVITNTLATGSELVLAKAVPAGVSNGARVRVWKLWTLGDVFGATNSAGLTGATTPENADVIMVPNGADFDRYFYSTGGAQGVGWRKIGAGTANQAGLTVPFAGGLIIHALVAKPILLVGQVKPGKTRVDLQTGRNILANLCPVNAAGEAPSAQGRTLSNSGLSDYLTGGRVSGLADLVLFWNGSGYTQYFYSTGGLGGVGWRRVGGGTVDQGGVALPDGAFAVQRRGAPVSIVINQGGF
jgi:uncharacterized protein (TIGR02597 family)